MFAAHNMVFIVNRPPSPPPGPPPAPPPPAPPPPAPPGGPTSPIIGFPTTSLNTPDTSIGNVTDNVAWYKIYNDTTNSIVFSTENSPTQIDTAIIVYDSNGDWNIATGQQNPTLALAPTTIKI